MLNSLVERAKSGDKKALEQVIQALMSEKADESVYSKVELYAWKWSKSLRDWDTDDILSQMRICIWTAICGPHAWNPQLKVSFKAYCWILFKRNLARQLIYERAQKRGGPTRPVHIDFSQVQLFVQLIHERQDNELTTDVVFEIDKFVRDLEQRAPEDRLILALLLQGYDVAEIGRILSTPRNVWNDYRVRQRIVNCIAKEPLLQNLKANVK